MQENKLSISAFSRIANCSRQNISSLVKKGILILDEKKKLDTENPTNKHYLSEREASPRIITNPGKNPKPEPVPEIKKEPEQIKATEKIDKPKTKRKTKKKTIEIDDEPLTIQKQRLEIDKLKEQRDKLKRENAEGRAELVSRHGMSDSLYGHLEALHKNIMGMPTGYIDDFETAMKAKYTRSQKIDILTLPICEAIEETKIEIKKEINRMIRQLKNG